MGRKIREILNSERAASFPMTIGIVLALIILLCGISEYFRLQVIAAHMGGFLMWDQVETYLVGRENLFLDTSFCVGRIPQETFLRLINRHGAEHILMGSDWPWASPKDTVDWIRGLPLPSSQIDAILGKNAAQLLGL